VRNKRLRELLSIDSPQGDLASGQTQSIKVTCTPKTVFESHDKGDGITLEVFDKDSGVAVDHGIPPIRVGVTAKHNAFHVTPPRGLNFGPVRTGESRTRQLKIQNVGTFPFSWCLFDPAEPPQFGDDDQPVIPAGGGGVVAGPFTVKWSSNQLSPGEEALVDVAFEANGDQEENRKLAMWVEGVHGGLANAGDAAGTSTAADTGDALPGCSVYTLMGQSCIPGINTKDMQTIFEEQFVAPTLENEMTMYFQSGAWFARVSPFPRAIASANNELQMRFANTRKAEIVNNSPEYGCCMIFSCKSPYTTRVPMIPAP
jgi:hypothetical protein